ncbi:hypothetical protein F8M49_21170 [Rhodococcus zopfii]|uniref:Uncharacterized protein n=1 Tax=Rhodococcus zopfii TaxID=43772 RepID=A0ABU3WU42_9NOCA|nr:hypothetical protein [Rhodococcus zopfii]
MSGRTDAPRAKEKAAPFAAGRPSTKTLEGNQMPYNLTSDDLEVEIGELIDHYREGAHSIDFGVLSIQRFTHDGSWSVRLLVDGRFTGEDVRTYLDDEGHVWHTITASGPELATALMNARNRFVESAPVEIAKGA